MQYAFCTDDERVWEANQFASLSEAELGAKRDNLLCTQCREFAWFRRASTHGHPPHFCAHHSENCELRVEYVVIDENRNDATVSVDEVSSSEQIIVRLDHEQGASVEVAEVKQPPESGEGTGGGRSHVIRGMGREASHQFTLRRILLRLVQSPQFRTSNSQVVLYRNADDVLISGTIRDIVSSFPDISRDAHHERLMLFWGPIASARKSKDGRLWLNSSSRNQGVSVVIFEDIADDFMQVFNIEDLESLSGAHVLVAGRCRYAQTGKPIIWCGSHKYIVVRRYRDERLQPEL